MKYLIIITAVLASLGFVGCSSMSLNKHAGAQPRPMTSGTNWGFFRPEGVVEGYLMERMSAEEKRALLKALNVDAIAIATVRVDLDNQGGLVKMLGAGRFHSVATIQFKLWDATSEDPIWMDLYAAGDATDEGVEHGLGFAAVDELHKQAVKSMQSALNKLVSRYQES